MKGLVRLLNSVYKYMVLFEGIINITKSLMFIVEQPIQTFDLYCKILLSVWQLSLWQLSKGTLTQQYETCLIVSFLDLVQYISMSDW